MTRSQAHAGGVWLGYHQTMAPLIGSAAGMRQPVRRYLNEDESSAGNDGVAGRYSPGL
jgi:hypothetical protein